MQHVVHMYTIVCVCLFSLLKYILYSLCSFCLLRVIKLTSPYLNIVIIIGAMLFYLDVVLFGLDEALVSVNILNGLCMVGMVFTHMHNN